jgi:hypothetical protein
MAEAPDDDRLATFCETVEAELGTEPLPDPHIGDICWLLIEYPIEFQGVTFEAEFDVNLSEDAVSLQWGEVLIDLPNKEREGILQDEASRIGGKDGEEALYEFNASEDQVPKLMDTLRTVHADVYG